MTIGLKNGTVRILPYNSGWAVKFETEKQRLLDLLAEKIISIEHIGSTAIPGMYAKPIIDINVAVKSLSDISDLVGPLQKLGYKKPAERLYNDRYFFLKRSGDFITHHLNIVEKSSETAWLNPILFRDYLISHPDALQEYCALKKDLASKYKNERDKYTEAKSSFVADIISKAIG